MGISRAAGGGAPSPRPADQPGPDAGAQRLAGARHRIPGELRAMLPPQNTRGLVSHAVPEAAGVSMDTSMDPVVGAARTCLHKTGSSISWCPNSF